MRKEPKTVVGIVSCLSQLPQRFDHLTAGIIALGINSNGLRKVERAKHLSRARSSRHLGNRQRFLYHLDSAREVRASGHKLPQGHQGKAYAILLAIKDIRRADEVTKLPRR